MGSLSTLVLIVGGLAVAAGDVYRGVQLVDVSGTSGCEIGIGSSSSTHRNGISFHG